MSGDQVWVPTGDSLEWVRGQVIDGSLVRPLGQIGVTEQQALAELHLLEYQDNLFL